MTTRKGANAYLVGVTTKKPKTPKRPKYPCTDIYCKVLEAKLGGRWLAELPFHPSRKWRFDYALEECKIAIEIDGGLWTGGRHSGGMGQKKDFEKLNAAAELGWLVFHYVPSEKMSAHTFLQLWRAIKQRRDEQSNNKLNADRVS